MPAPGDDCEALPGSLPENDQGGFFMRQPVSDSRDSEQTGFQKIVDGFLLQPGLPFSDVLSSQKINDTFRKHGGLFGKDGIYNTHIVLWAFLGQVLRDRKEAACQAAVAGIISFCLQVGRTAPTSDTGDYCRARSRSTGTQHFDDIRIWFCTLLRSV